MALISTHVGDVPDKPFDDITDLNVAVWFPEGFSRVTLYNVPGTSISLKASLEILVSRDMLSAPRNFCVLSMFHRVWRGNILVVMKTQVDADNSVSCLRDVRRKEMRVIDLIVALWLFHETRSSLGISFGPIGSPLTVLS
ncbi:hypothetical protein PLICRDRAFT_171386 [Plicaturopsis crispa FD-325 SS-3]|nr:hypothetical protein PLICRDRAFT_171386 [Plicaturopsis crispa FD-325 SS-3]